MHVAHFTLATLASCAAIASPGYVQYDLVKKDLPVETAFTTNLHKKGSNVWIPLELGSEGKVVDFLFDTGSSATWCTQKLYDPTTSSKWHNESWSFSIYYADGHGGKGSWGRDQIGVPGTNGVAQNVSIGTAWTASAYSALFGAGPFQTKYDSLMVQLKHQGLTNSAAFGFWVDSQHGNGSVTFGGIDTQKYEGKLQKVPIVSIPKKNDDGTYTYPDRIHNSNAILNSVSITSSKGETQDVVTDAALPCCFDTGSIPIHIPKKWHIAIGEAFGATWNEKKQRCVIEEPPKGNITFGFSGVDITVDMAASWWDEYTDDDGKKMYLFDVHVEDDKPSITNNMVFGLQFLKFAYLVFDFEHGEIGLAQAAVDVGDAQYVEPIGTDGMDVPKAPGYATSTYKLDYKFSKPTSFA